MQTRIALVGASGYSGVEATKLLASHPNVELAVVTSERWAGETLARRVGLSGRCAATTYSPQTDVPAVVAGCPIVLLATPAEVSADLAPKLLARGQRVIDFSGAFRLKDLALHKRFYGFEHPAPEIAREAVYGLPELTDRAAIANARLVANPGCYATACALLGAAMLGSNQLEPGSLIFDAASGVTGAGRKATEEMSFSEVEGDYRAYRTLKHQHTPEIAQTLEASAGRRVAVTFTPHLLPVKRGILVTAYARLRSGGSAAGIREYALNVYSRQPFVDVLEKADDVGLKLVVGTNKCSLAWSADESGLDERRVVGVSALDNLVKGAAGQAVQNLNLMLGLDPSTGLAALRAFHP